MPSLLNVMTIHALVYTYINTHNKSSKIFFLLDTQFQKNKSRIKAVGASATSHQTKRCFLKKNLNASRPSQHSPVKRGGGGGRGNKNLFMLLFKEKSERTHLNLVSIPTQSEGGSII